MVRNTKFKKENKLKLKDSEIQKIHDEEIDGDVFLDLTDELLKSLDFSLGKRIKFINLINYLKSQSKFYHKIV